MYYWACNDTVLHDFEDRKPQAREVLLIAVMAAIAVVGRMAFFMSATV